MDFDGWTGWSNGQLQELKNMGMGQFTLVRPVVHIRIAGIYGCSCHEWYEHFIALILIAIFFYTGSFLKLLLHVGTDIALILIAIFSPLFFLNM